MSTKFYTLLTDIGAAKLASAAALGVPLKITHMAVGDGGGTLPTPDAKQPALVNEKRRAALHMLYIDPQNSSQIIAEQVIPENEGGWWIREVGLFDESGALIAVGNCPESYKPQLAEGSGRTQTVRMVLITSSTDNITLKIDPAVVLATRKYVDDKVLELKVYVDDLMAKHTAASDPHTQYAPKASPTFTGTPKAPTAAAGNNSTQLATTAFVQAAIAALVDSSPGALDTLNELAKALGNDPNFATTMTNALAGKMDKSANGEDIPDKDIFLQNAGVGTAGKRNVGSGSGQIPDMSFFQSTKCSNGIQYLPGGIIIQWGIWQLTAVGNYNAETIGGITWYTHYTKPLYTIAFPNMALVNYVGLAGSVFEGQINEYNTFVRSNMSAGSDGKAGSRTNACVSVTSRILGYTPTVHWLAIGY